MIKNILLAVAVVATSLTFTADTADAFGGRGYARRQARRAYSHHHHHVVAPVVVQRVYTAPVVTHYRAPVYHHPPVYHQPPVAVQVGRYGSYYGTGYYGGGVSVSVGW